MDSTTSSSKLVNVSPSAKQRKSLFSSNQDTMSSSSLSTKNKTAALSTTAKQKLEYPWLELPSLLVELMGGILSVGFGNKNSGGISSKDNRNTGYSNKSVNSDDTNVSQPGLEIVILIPLVLPEHTLNNSTSGVSGVGPGGRQVPMLARKDSVRSLSSMVGQPPSQSSSPRLNTVVSTAPADTSGCVAAGGGTQSAAVAKTTMSDFTVIGHDTKQPVLHQDSGIADVVSISSDSKEFLLNRTNSRFFVGLDESSDIYKNLKMVRNLRILIVDDNIMIIKLKIRALQPCLRGNSNTTLSSNVTVAYSSEEALEICEKERGRFDVVIVSHKINPVPTPASLLAAAQPSATAGVSTSSDVGLLSTRNVQLGYEVTFFAFALNIQ